ncbi:MAG: hypothetical protein M3311_01435 [Thermoproteota archaeon]|nr:hypothetical protein [Thermoproteota archaeon]
MKQVRKRRLQELRYDKGCGHLYKCGSNFERLFDGRPKLKAACAIASILSIFCRIGNESKKNAIE